MDGQCDIRTSVAAGVAVGSSPRTLVRRGRASGLGEQSLSAEAAVECRLSRTGVVVDGAGEASHARS